MIIIFKLNQGLRNLFIDQRERIEMRNFANCRGFFLFIILAAVWLEYINGFMIKIPRYFNIAACRVTSLDLVDPEINSLLSEEKLRQREGINLIASENFVSPSVLEALGSEFVNKYSEGLPWKRYYGGNQFIDQVELLCQNRALDLFGLSPSDWSVNVQPYSGTPANLAVYTGLLSPQDRIMGLDLSCGGHLSHGYQTSTKKVTASSKFFESVPYFVNRDTGLVDYDGLESLATSVRPKLIICGASSYPRDWDYFRLRQIADKAGSLLMSDISHMAGLIAAKEAHSPFPLSDIVTTTTHKTLRGPRSGMIFSRKGELSDKINSGVFPGVQGGPHNNQIAAVAVSLLEAKQPHFAAYINQVKRNARVIASWLISNGYSVISNGNDYSLFVYICIYYVLSTLFFVNYTIAIAIGTDNHLVLWNLNHTTGITGDKLERIAEYCSIYVNKNAVPGDVAMRSPSGIRLGTAAMTTLGMKEEDMVTIMEFLHRCVKISTNIIDSFRQQNPSKSACKLHEFEEEMKHQKFQEQISSLKSAVKNFMTTRCHLY